MTAMTLKEQLQQDMLNAMKAGEKEKLEVLRMVKAAIMKFEVSGGEKKNVSDEEVMTILNKEVKQRKETAIVYKQGGREDLAAKEENEAAILATYLPAQMSEEEIRAVVKEVLAATGAKSAQEIGKVMGALMPKVKGKADGQLVNKIVKELLQ